MIYISVPREMHGNYSAVFKEQNAACLETALSYEFVIQKTFFDFKGRIYNAKRPNLDWLFNYLKKKNKRYCIIIQNISILSPDLAIQRALLEPFRKLRKVRFIEACRFEGDSETLKELGLSYCQLELDLDQLTEEQ